LNGKLERQEGEPSVRQPRNQLIDEALHAHRRLTTPGAAAMQTWLHLDLTMLQLKALFALHEAGVLTISQLATALGAGRSTASLLVSELVGRQLVTRDEDRNDRRRTFVCLSDDGAALLAQLRAGALAGLDARLARLSDDDLAALTRGLRALAATAAP
jgi:DNA-binding MarR family transcriptional regulator